MGILTIDAMTPIQVLDRPPKDPLKKHLNLHFGRKKLLGKTSNSVKFLICIFFFPLQDY